MPKTEWYSVPCPRCHDAEGVSFFIEPSRDERYVLNFNAVLLCGCRLEDIEDESLRAVIADRVQILIWENMG